MRFLLFLCCLFLLTCTAPKSSVPIRDLPTTPYIVVLGVAQDAGHPQANCQKKCCKAAWKNPKLGHQVSCLGLVDPVSEQVWVLDATPDFREQLQRLQTIHPYTTYPLAGIFITHGHMGHYTGLMHLGREAMGAKEVPVYTMPRMQQFLETSGPWSQLVSLKNIVLQPLRQDSIVVLTEQLQVIPIEVPHRDEFSETVGFKIKNKEKTALFIPDIDKWNLWERDILQEIRSVDVAFLDGTFFQNGEIPNRDMSEIPHPFIEESIALFQQLAPEDRQKVHFIHFNHTNPVLQPNSDALKVIEKAGLRVAHEGAIHSL